MAWNKTLQLRLFQFNIKYSLLILRIFGVWPYIIDRKSRTFKTTWYLKLYPLIFLIVICKLMIHDSPTFHSTEFEWKSDAANMLVSFYGISLANCLFTLFIDQYYKYKDIELLIKCGQLLYTKFTQYFDETELKFGHLLNFYTFKSIFMTMILSYSIMEKMYMLSATIQRSMSVVAIHFVILIVPNLFVASMLTVYFLFKQINFKIECIVRLATNLSSEIGAPKKRHFRMRRNCELSDRLDEMAFLHMEMCKIMQTISTITTLQLTNYITLKFTSILVQLFFVYMYLSVWTQQDKQFPCRLIINDIESILLNAFELAAITQICYMAAREVNMNT